MRANASNAKNIRTRPNTPANAPQVNPNCTSWFQIKDHFSSLVIPHPQSDTPLPTQTPPQSGSPQCPQSLVAPSRKRPRCTRSGAVLCCSDAIPMHRHDFVFCVEFLHRAEPSVVIHQIGKYLFSVTSLPPKDPNSVPILTVAVIFIVVSPRFVVCSSQPLSRDGCRIHYRQTMSTPFRMFFYFFSGGLTP